MEYILEVANLNKAYKDNNFKINNVSFKVPYGTIVGFIGDNGAGKSTVIDLILNIKHRESGTIKLFGKEFEIDDTSIKEKIGVVFDENYFPQIANCKDISQIFKHIYKKWDEKYFFDKLNQFGISKTKKIEDYSKGMKTTLSIIVALSYHPQLLILDEPTSGLDPIHREDILQIFQEFIENENNSIIFSSHITSDIEKIADYVIFIHEGEVIIREEKDNVLYQFGILRCNRKYFEKMDKFGIIKYMAKEFEYTVLVSDQNIYRKLDSEYILENPTLEEVIYLISKGKSI